MMEHAGRQARSGALFTFVDLELRVGNPCFEGNPLLVNEALTALEKEFSAIYSPMGRDLSLNFHPPAIMNLRQVCHAPEDWTGRR